MTPEDLQLLKENENKVVRIVCTNGEIMLAKIYTVSDEDGDVIYDLVRTTNEAQYEKHDQQPAYLIRFQDIKHVELLQGS